CSSSRSCTSGWRRTRVLRMPLTRRCRSISRKGSTVPIDYRLVRSRRRSLELRIYPDRRIEVRAPLRCPQRDIDMFVSSRKNWIEKKLQVLPEYQGTPAAKDRKSTRLNSSHV